MSAPSKEKRSVRPAARASQEPGVLSSLPSTRPQRPSARRAAARQSAAAKAERVAAKPKRNTRPKPKPTAKPLVAPKPAEPPVPRQGFESEETIEMGQPVQPPSSSELAASMVELVGELAQTGLSAGGRVLRDALTRLAGG
jgi:hypothetical protein